MIIMCIGLLMYVLMHVLILATYDFGVREVSGGYVGMWNMLLSDGSGDSYFGVVRPVVQLDPSIKLTKSGVENTWNINK